MFFEIKKMELYGKYPTNIYNSYRLDERGRAVILYAVCIPLLIDVFYEITFLQG